MPAPIAFVAGATGYTGREVVAALRARGVTTIAHIRPGSGSGARLGAGFRAQGAVVDETPWEPDAMRATLARHRPTLVFALLGTTRARAKREGLAAPYAEVDYGLTKILLDAAVAAAAAGADLPPRFVYLSAIGARENTGNAYVAVRGRLEREIAESGLPHLLVRPAFITGSDREEARPAERIAGVMSDALLRLSSALTRQDWFDRYGSLTGKSLAEGMVAVALEANGPREVADVGRLRAASARNSQVNGVHQ